MQTSLRQFEIPQRPGSRSAFTLVELLVVVTIFSILATLVISGFTLNDADRVGNSIATFKNAIEGARSRAVSSQSVRGLRLLTDPNNPRLVRSLVYVESPGTDDGLCDLQYLPGVRSWRVVNLDDPNTTNLNAPENLTNETWNDFQSRGLLQPGLRIEIPRDSGNWYTVRQFGIDVLDVPDVLSARPAENPMSFDVALISGMYEPSIFDPSAGPSGNYVAALRTRVPYRLELAPVVAEGATPIQLDPQTCIDLDGSRLPESWRLREDTDRNGVIDGSETDLNDPITGTPNGLFDFANRYSGQMDILFGPDGTVSGDLRSSGILHFRLCYLSDAILAEPLRQRALSFDYTAVGGYPNFIVPVDPEREHMALSLFPQTGAVVISEISRKNDDGNEIFNQRVDATPFEFAVRGREANQ